MSASVVQTDLIRDHGLLWVYSNERRRERDLASRVDYPVPEVGKRTN
jgi:hypothetical protein